VGQKKNTSRGGGGGQKSVLRGESGLHQEPLVDSTITLQMGKRSSLTQGKGDACFGEQGEDGGGKKKKKNLRKRIRPRTTSTWNKTHCPPKGAQVKIWERKHKMKKRADKRNSAVPRPRHRKREKKGTTLQKKYELNWLEKVVGGVSKGPPAKQGHLRGKEETGSINLNCKKSPPQKKGRKTKDNT